MTRYGRSKRRYCKGGLLWSFWSAPRIYPLNLGRGPIRTAAAG